MGVRACVRACVRANGLDRPPCSLTVVFEMEQDTRGMEAPSGNDGPPNSNGKRATSPENSSEPKVIIEHPLPPGGTLVPRTTSGDAKYPPHSLAPSLSPP